MLSLRRALFDRLLTPTRIYVKPLLALLRELPVHALAHITGGGLSENIPRVLPDHVAARIDLGAFTPPPVFGWLAKAGRLSDAEMLKTFNCGIGMVVVAAKAQADAVLGALRAAGENPVLIGEIVPPGGARSEAKGKGEDETNRMHIPTLSSLSHAGARAAVLRWLSGRSLSR